MDLIKKELSLPLLKNVISYRIFNKNIYYLDSAGVLFKSDLAFNQREADSRYRLEIFPGFISIMEEETLSLYRFNPETGDFEKFLKARELKMSADKKKLTLVSSAEIWVLFLAEIFDQPQRKAGETTFLTRFSEKIENIFWLTSHYLIFSAGDKIKITEIDERGRINIVDLTFKSPGGSPINPEKPTIFLSNSDKKLYLLNNHTLYVSDALIK